MQDMRSTGRHDSEESTPSVLTRAMTILAAFDGQRRPLGTSELARRTGLAKSTVHRLTRELTHHGLLERRGDGLVLGLRLFEFGQLVPRQLDLRTAALPYMADLRAATRQTVHLAVLDATDVVYVEILRSHDAPTLPSRIGGRLPAHATAVGKAILAFSGSDAIDRVLRAGLPRLAERTITAAHLLQRNLKLVRANGIAYDYEESQAGLVCAASPITGADGAVAGALSVSGWAGLLNVRRIGPAVRTAALALSRDLTSATH
jgi:IclR family acetate operon transcriptional repressor